MPWICRSFDSHQNSGGNSDAFLQGFTRIYCVFLTGYSPRFEVSQDARFQYGRKTTNQEYSVT